MDDVQYTHVCVQKQSKRRNDNNNNTASGKIKMKVLDALTNYGICDHLREGEWGKARVK